MMAVLNRCFLFHFLVGVLAIGALVRAQGQSGFISLDCGLAANGSYTASKTGINYVSDANYVETGVSGSIDDKYKDDYPEQVLKLRSFPQGVRNCYTINVVKGTNYLIRASFLYGNYDGLNQVPVFDLYYGVNLWETIKPRLETRAFFSDIIDVPSKNRVQICLVDTGRGTPFISAIELRPLESDNYRPPFGSLYLEYRLDTGSVSNRSYRYSTDVNDRYWSAYNEPEWTQLSTSLTVDSASQSSYQLPSAVTSTAATPVDVTKPLNFEWTPSNSRTKYFVYMHFAEVMKLESNQTRSFNITLNGDIWFGPVIPEYLVSNTVYSTRGSNSAEMKFSLVKNGGSTLPPILNAIEVFTSVDYSGPETDKVDVDAMNNIKSTYKINKNWQGDPCAPAGYSWEGLQCNLTAPFRITNLSLSSSGLTGGISPSIGSLEILRILDLSNNSLTQSVPIFLTQLKFLQVLKLDNNNLTGTIPAELVKRAKDGSLSLSITDNPNIDQCQLTSCTSGSALTTGKKKTSIVGPVIGSICGVVALAAIVGAVVYFMKWKRQTITTPEQKHSDRLIEVSYQSEYSSKSTPLNSALDTFDVKGRQFSHSEVVNMTNNFERALGRGGFGTVYHGYAGDTPVAVKILSTSSARGYQQFITEVNLLLRVHHRNLTSLVGYMNEGTNVGLIYEFMANGDLAEHLSGSSTKILTWEDRLRIALDSAQGLEYLHDGCKPPIIHRDVKTTNILLNEKFQAKIADFGLSKDNPDNGKTHVATTVVAGTPGYLDPEYYLSNRLTEKSDIYSFGVVLLEIISSREVISRNNEVVHINQWANSKFAQGDVRSIVDPRLEGNYDVNSVWKYVELALDCVSKPERRPPMSVVVNELKACLATELSRKNQSRRLDSLGSFDMVSMTMTTDSSVPVAR